MERMLEYSPPLPIALDYARKDRGWTVEDGDGILLALQHRARVRRIRLCVPHLHERKLFTALEMEFPMAEYLYIEILSPTEMRPGLEIHHTFQAPRLSHLALTSCSLLVASPSLTTSAGLVTLSLMLLPSYHPYDLLQQLSLLSQLVVLRIADWYASTLDLVWQQLDIPSITHLTLPNLRVFDFTGQSNFLETFLPWMTTPLLEKLQITFIPDMDTPNPTYTLPCLLQSLSKEGVPSFGSAKLFFTVSEATVWVYSQEGSRVYVFYLCIITKGFGLQVSDMTEIFEDLSPAISTVVDLTIDFSGHYPSYGRPTPTQWHDLLGSFNHVKTLRVHGSLAENFSNCLLSDGEPIPGPEVLPELQVLECPVGCDASDTFATFVDVRKAAGYPISLILVDPPGPSPASTGL